MPSPEQRFEVPPEYADVYERAYRRAYDEGQGQLSGPVTEAPTRRSSVRGKRIAVPEQRTPRRSAPPRSPSGVAPARTVPPRATRIPTQRAAPPRASTSFERAGHRAPPRGGSTLYPVLSLTVLMVLLVVGAFFLGRATAGTVSGTDAPQAGTGPGATASATEGPSQTVSSVPAPGPYRGPTAPVRILAARAACTAPGGDGAQSPRNVLDRDPHTAWVCTGATGQQLVLTLPRHSEVVAVGLVEGYGKHNVATKVAWIFDNGTRVFQTLSGRPHDHSSQQLRIVPMSTDIVKLRIISTVRGPKDVTSIGTVRLNVSARGSD